MRGEIFENNAKNVFRSVIRRCDDRVAGVEQLRGFAVSSPDSCWRC
jgi:hypothetical protein